MTTIWATGLDDLLARAIKRFAQCNWRDGDGDDIGAQKDQRRKGFIPKMKLLTLCNLKWHAVAFGLLNCSAQVLLN